MNRKTRSSCVLGLILVGAFLSISLLVACSSQLPGGSSAPPIAKSATVVARSQPTATSTPVVATLMPTTTSVGSTNQCGTVTLAPNGTLLQAAAAKQIEDCFWRAYQQCKPASLVLSVGGVDTVSIHTFNIEQQQGGCVVSDIVQTRIIPQPLGPKRTYTCAQLENTGTGLRAINCGDEGSINIPNS